MSTTETPQEPEGARLAEQLAKAIGGIGVPEAHAQEQTGASWRERAEAAEARLAELENAVTWGISCLSCSRVLDSAYTETLRAEAAEEKLAAIAEHCRQRLDAAIVQGPVSKLCRDILAIIGNDEGVRDGR